MYICVCGQTNATFRYKPAENQTGSVADKTDAFYALRTCSLLCPSCATCQWTQRLRAELKPRMRVWEISAVKFSKACLNLSIWTRPRTWPLTTAKAKFPLPRSGCSNISLMKSKSKAIPSATCPTLILVGSSWYFPTRQDFKSTTREKSRGCTFKREKGVWYATLETLSSSYRTMF